jgi:ribosomal protein S18 acetylase RimI-like enzyme
MTTIRRADESDPEPVLELWRAAGAVPTITDDIDALRLLLGHDRDALLLAIGDDGELAGTLIAVWNGWRGSFWRLAVLPDHRRRGIARELVRAGEERLRALGARRVESILVDGEEPGGGGGGPRGGNRHEDRPRLLR